MTDGNGEIVQVRERIAQVEYEFHHPPSNELAWDRIKDEPRFASLVAVYYGRADAVLDALGLVPVARYEPTKWAVGPAGSPMEQKPLPYLTFLAWDDDPYADIDMPEGEVVYRLTAQSGSSAAEGAE